MGPANKNAVTHINKWHFHATISDETGQNKPEQNVPPKCRLPA